MSDVEMMIAQVCEDDERIWFYDNIYHYVCFSDCNFDEVHIEREIDIQEIKNLGTGINVYKQNHNLYIAFQGKPAVLAYSIASKEYRILCSNLEMDENFYSVEETNGYFLFIPQKVNGKIFLFDICKEIFVQKEWTNGPFIKSGGMTSYVYKTDQEIFFPLYNTNQILEIDLSDYKCVAHTYEKLMISTMCSCGNRKWIAQTNCAELVCVEQENINEPCQYRRYNSDTEDREEFFSRLLIYDEKVIGIPRFGDYVLLVDRQKGKTVRLYHGALKRHEKTKTSLTYGYYFKNYILYLLPWGTHKLLCVDIKNELLYEKKIKMPVVDYLKYFYINPRYEKNKNDLENYLGWIALKDIEEINNGHETEPGKMVGEKIYRNIINAMQDYG